MHGGSCLVVQMLSFYVCNIQFLFFSCCCCCCCCSFALCFPPSFFFTFLVSFFTFYFLNFFHLFFLCSSGFFGLTFVQWSEFMCRKGYFLFVGLLLDFIERFPCPIGVGLKNIINLEVIMNRTLILLFSGVVNCFSKHPYV